MLPQRDVFSCGPALRRKRSNAAKGCSKHFQLLFLLWCVPGKPLLPDSQCYGLEIDSLFIPEEIKWHVKEITQIHKDLIKESYLGVRRKTEKEKRVSKQHLIIKLVALVLPVHCIARITEFDEKILQPLLWFQAKSLQFPSFSAQITHKGGLL